MQANTVEDVEAQDRLLRAANEKIERLKCAADMLIGAEFLTWEQRELIEEELNDEERAEDETEGWEPSWARAKKVTEQFRRAARTRAGLSVVAHFEDADWDSFPDECALWLNGQTPCHWPLEFPEVIVEHGGFDAFVGNPPFMGGKMISTNVGQPYREYMVSALAGDTKGHADLCAYFFLRAADLVHTDGQFGFLATNTIAQGVTREVALDRLLEASHVLIRAVSSRKWPGTANLEVSHVWVRRGQWCGPYILDDKQVAGITAYLTETGVVQGNPYTLMEAQDKAFIGTVVYGDGFVLTVEKAHDLLKADPRNNAVLRPYLIGDDINSSPTHSPSRFVIDFGDREQKEAELYKECFDIVETLVKPDRLKAPEKRMREKWWLYQRPRPALYAAISHLPHFLVKSRVSEHHILVFAKPGMVMSDAIVVFALETFYDFAILQSTVHEAWARHYSSSLETRMRYTPSDCTENYPFPMAKSKRVSVCGQEYYEHREAMAVSRQQGLTKIYNRFHDPDEICDDIKKLRELHVEMDNAVAAAYGWNDLGHGFHTTKRGHPLYDQRIGPARSSRPPAQTEPRTLRRGGRQGIAR